MRSPVPDRTYVPILLAARWDNVLDDAELVELLEELPEG